MKLRSYITDRAYKISRFAGKYSRQIAAVFLVIAVATVVLLLLYDGSGSDGDPAETMSESTTDAIDDTTDNKSDKTDTQSESSSSAADSASSGWSSSVSSDQTKSSEITDESGNTDMSNAGTTRNQTDTEITTSRNPSTSTGESTRETTTQNSLVTTRVPTTETTKSDNTLPTSATTPGETTSEPINGLRPDWPIYYVAKSGVDSSTSGNSSKPFKTIQYAIEHVPAGSIIAVSPGIYSERLDLTGRYRVYITNAGSELPVLSGGSYTDGYLVEISGADQITLDHFEIRDFRGDDLECVLIRRASRQVTISSCAFTNIGVNSPSGNAHIILAKGDSAEPLTDISICRNTIARCYTGYSESVTMESNVDGFEIIGNLIHDVTNIAIDVTGFYSNGVNNPVMNQARNGLIAGNTIYNAVSPYASCAGIYVDGGRNIVIENNTVHNSMYGIEIGCENRVDEDQPSYLATASDVKVRYNLIYACSEAGIVVGGYDMAEAGKVTNCEIYHNTLFKNNDEIDLAHCSDIDFYRNIIFGSGLEKYFMYHYADTAISGLNSDNNIFFTDQGNGRFKLSGKYASTLEQWRLISGQDMHSFMSDPLFVKSGSDFHLRSESPAQGYGRYP